MSAIKWRRHELFPNIMSCKLENSFGYLSILRPYKFDGLYGTLSLPEKPYEVCFCDRSSYGLSSNPIGYVSPGELQLFISILQTYNPN